MLVTDFKLFSAENGIVEVSLNYGRSVCIIGKPQKDIFDTIFISPIEKSKVGRQARKLHSFTTKDCQIFQI